MISEKQLAAEAAVEYVKDGMIVGLGTGSTTEFAVKKLGEKVRNGLAIKGIPTSLVTKKLEEAAKSIDISIHDHLIIAGNDVYSFADNGLI